MIETSKRTVELSRVKIEGTTFVTECDITTVTDIRDTIVGPWNFGWTHIARSRTREVSSEAVPEAGPKGFWAKLKAAF